MNREEAEEYANNMTYRGAVYNALQGKCIPYRKATLTKLYELLDMIELLERSEKFQQKAEVVISQLRADRDRLEDAHRWIPVSERLPEEDGYYLVTVKGLLSTHYELLSFTNNLYKLGKNDFPDKKRPGWYFFTHEYGYIVEPDVIAWMPLPKPFNKESEDKE